MHLLLHLFRPASVGLLLFFAVLSWARAEEGQFLSQLPDLPLLESYAELEDLTLVFDTAGGRIVESYAVGTIEAELVFEFYSKTLPQLGWRETGANQFDRETERLTLELVALPSGRGNLLRFTLVPKP